MPQRADDTDGNTGWKPVYTFVVGTLAVTLLLLELFSRYFSG